MRVANWQEVLYAKVEEWRLRPFAWGSVDCFQFVADVVLALTGVDHRERFGAYTTETEALAIIERTGGVEAMLTQCLGEPKHASRAMRGDLVGFPVEHGLSPAICLGVKSVGVGPEGMMLLETAKAILAWTV